MIMSVDLSQLQELENAIKEENSAFQQEKENLLLQIDQTTMHNGKIFLEIEQISKKLLFLKENIIQKSENYLFSFDLISKLISKNLPNKNNQAEILSRKLEAIYKLNHEKNLNLKEELKIKFESRPIRLEKIEKPEKKCDIVQDTLFTSFFDDVERILERKKNEILDLHRDLSKKDNCILYLVL